MSQKSPDVVPSNRMEGLFHLNFTVRKTHVTLRTDCYGLVQNCGLLWIRRVRPTLVRLSMRCAIHSATGRPCGA